jgi:chaperonin GroES
MLKPLGDRVVLQVSEAPEQSVGDLTAPVAVKEGDQVIFDKYAGAEISIDGVDYLVVHEKDIVAVL